MSYIDRATEKERDRLSIHILVNFLTSVLRIKPCSYMVVKILTVRTFKPFYQVPQVQEVGIMSWS